MLLLLLLLSTGAAHGLNNGAAQTPPLGWMTWQRYRCNTNCSADPHNCISEELVKQHADILSQPEWRDLGYSYVNIDDCWANWNRTADGLLAPNSTRFPSGMKALSDYVHSKGLQLGTCEAAVAHPCWPLMQ